MAILSDKTIKEYLESGKIAIDPLEDEISDPEEDSLAGQLAAARGQKVKKAAEQASDDEESGTDEEEDSSDSSSDSDSD